MKRNFLMNFLLLSTAGMAISLASCKEEHTHTLIHFDAKAPTCTTAGSKEYWQCDECDKFFLDEEAKIETTAEELKVAALGHDLVKTEAKNPTCTSAGNKEYYTCSRCDLLFSDAEGKIPTTLEEVTLPITSHNLVYTAAKNPTCTEAGNIEYYTCSLCNKIFKDADAKDEITLEDAKVAPLGHKLDKVVAVEPTCTKAGNIEYYKCTVCNKLFKDAKGEVETTLEEVTIPTSGHKLTKIEAKEPTCTEDGNIEYYTCDTCNKLFKDAKGEVETTLEEVTLKATHKLTKHEANTTSNGKIGNIEYYSCDVCGKYYLDAEATKEITHDKVFTNVKTYNVKSFGELNNIIAKGENAYIYLDNDLDYRTDPQEISVDININCIINGQGHKILGSANRFSGNSIQDALIINQNNTKNISVTFKDISIETFEDASRCLDTRGKIDEINLINTKLVAHGHTISPSNSHNQLFSIGGNQAELAKINIIDSTLTADETGYGLISFNPIDLTITNSKITAWSAVYLKFPSGSAGTSGSIVNINDSELICDTYVTGDYNVFGAIAVEDGGSSITLNNTKVSCLIKAPSSEEYAYQSLLSLYNGGVNKELGVNFTVKGNSVIEGYLSSPNNWPEDNLNIQLEGGSYTDIDCLNYVATGYEAVGEGPYTIQKIK